MPNRQIPDWKKAVIAGMSVKYGDGSLARKLDVGKGTVRKYRKKAEKDGELEMSGPNLKVKQ